MEMMKKNEYNEIHLAESWHGTINKVSSVLQNKICHFSIFDLFWALLGVAVALRTGRYQEKYYNHWWLSQARTNAHLFPFNKSSLHENINSSLKVSDFNLVAYDWIAQFSSAINTQCGHVN